MSDDLILWLQEVGVQAPVVHDQDFHRNSGDPGSSPGPALALV